MQLYSPSKLAVREKKYALTQATAAHLLDPLATFLTLRAAFARRRGLPMLVGKWRDTKAMTALSTSVNTSVASCIMLQVAPGLKPS